MSKKHIITCDDGESFEISRECLRLMQTLNNFEQMAEEDGLETGDEAWPVDMNSEWFKKFVEYCNYHAENPNVYKDADNKDPIFMVDFDKKFIEQFMDTSKNHVDLLEFYRLSHYLDIPEGRKLVSKKLVTMVYNSKNPNDIRKQFGLPEVAPAPVLADDSGAAAGSA